MEDEDLIKEFMGWTFVPESKLVQAHYQKVDDWMSVDATYASSWDMLMTVVEKINHLYDEAFPPNEKFIELILNHQPPIDEHYTNVIALPLSTPINEVYEAVVVFIKWYYGSK
jgi:hypothetical protein